jgi:hypothetical protein
LGRGAIHRARDFSNHSLPLLGGGGRGSRNRANETPPSSSFDYVMNLINDPNVLNQRNQRNQRNRRNQIDQIYP